MSGRSDEPARGGRGEHPHPTEHALVERAPTGLGRARGLVSSRLSGRRVDAHAFVPPPDVADAVQVFWVGRWELPLDAPHHSQLLSDPCVHIVVEGGDRIEARVVGVWTRLWQRTLHGRGWVRGVKLRAGAVRAFIDQPAVGLQNRVVSCEAIFGDAGAALAQLILDATTDELAFERFGHWLRSRRRFSDESQLAIALVDRLAADAEITTAERLAQVAGMGLRGLQRLFRDHVGASPKWVIRRHRLQEVAARLERGEGRSLAALAAELGYTDQAHLTRDFKSAVGKSPREFATLVHR